MRGGRILFEIFLFVVGIAIKGAFVIPFALDVVLQLPLYMSVGKLIQKKEQLFLSIKGLVSSGLFWIVFNALIILNNPIHIGMGNYYSYPLCYLAAVSGTIACFGVGKLITKKNRFFISRFICFVGRNSLWLFCVHALDFFWMQYIPMLSIPNSIVRVCIDLAFVTLIATINRYFKDGRK